MSRESDKGPLRPIDTIPDAASELADPTLRTRLPDHEIEQLENLYEKAKELIDGFLAGVNNGDAWQCPACGEHSEAQFTACWRCGAERPLPFD